MTKADEPRRSAEYSVEDLARAARTTVRNVRAYQDRGLIPPPERRGRIGVYNESHLSRLRIIGQMLERGYTLSSIGELLEAWERGSDLAGLLGLESAVSSPWTDETPKLYSLTELVKLFGGSFKLPWLVKAAELGILVPEGARFRAPSPRMIQAGAELVKAGIPLDEMLDVVAQLRGNVELAADRMVQLVEQHLFDRFGKGLPPAEEVPRLGEIIWRLRPLVEMAVHAEVARAMEAAATRHLGDRLAAILDHMTQAKKKAKK
ncbi:MerR family transcriptional regulator [Sinimarinibacterium thermocellulolyticum]|uniref:MerR family transcriptional regulator n=1 Tax=Sinimarinibacterium thermocellulolyticum TaxID=3170016 RepID=UPI00333A41F5